MTNLASKLKTIFWYLSRPNYYGQLARLLKRKILKPKVELTRKESTEWCSAKSISTEKTLQLITGHSYATNIEQIYSAEFNEAKEKEKSCPVKMGGPGDLNLLYNLCEFIQAKNVIETGVAYGWSSFSILLSISKRDGVLISTDMPYAKMNNEDYVGVVVPDKLHKHWNLIRLPDDTGLRIALEKIETLDLCHYDSDKTYAGRLFGYGLLWAALRPGGIFISDDISDNMGFHDFCEKNKLDAIIVEDSGRYVGIILKK